jgi:hypothetical protein
MEKGDHVMSDRDQNQQHSSVDRRGVLRVSAIGLVSTFGISAMANPSVAQEGNQTNESTTENETDTSTESSETDTETEDDDDGSSDDETASCEGAPSMSRTSVTTPNSRITKDDPAVVEANFRPEPTIPEGCTIMVDLEFSFTDAGFQWGGGANWDQSTSDLVVGTFEVRPGEIRDIRGELHTQGAEAGDEVTVIADYELWFEGNREESVQQSGIRHTIEVEAPNPPENESEEDISVSASADSSPGFGIISSLSSIGAAGYLAKSKLGETNE